MTRIGLHRPVMALAVVALAFVALFLWWTHADYLRRVRSAARYRLIDEIDRSIKKDISKGHTPQDERDLPESLVVGHVVKMRLMALDKAREEVDYQLTVDGAPKKLVIPWHPSHRRNNHPNAHQSDQR